MDEPKIGTNIRRQLAGIHFPASLPSEITTFLFFYPHNHSIIQIHKRNRKNELKQKGRTKLYEIHTWEF